MSIKRVIAGLGLLFTMVSVHANGSLLIYPVRVAFDEVERSAQVTLTNTSDQTNTYRLEWREKLVRAEGGYNALTEDEAKDLPIASSMLRYSPRQVTLKAGERQLIKLKLRRPRGLAEGEYRSHLLFKAVPPDNDVNNASSSTTINIMLSFSIPVTIQQGQYDTQVSLEQANITYNPSAGTRTVSLDLARKGLHSSSGHLSAYWTAEGGKEILLAKLSDYNLWSELSEIRASLISTKADFTPSDGRLRIHYEGARDFRGITYLDEVIEVKRSQIVIKK